MDARDILIQQRCKALLQSQDGQLPLNKLFEIYTKKYGKSFIQDSNALMLCLQTDSFIFETTEYNYCLLDDNAFHHSGGYITDKAAELLKNHNGRYSLSVLLQKMIDNKYVLSTMTENVLLSFLNRYPYITVEKRSFIVCKLKETPESENQIAQQRPTTEPKAKVEYTPREKSLKDTVIQPVKTSTNLILLMRSGYISSKEVEHCVRKGLCTVGDVIRLIDKHQLTADSTRFTQYTLNILFKIRDLWISSGKSLATKTARKGRNTYASTTIATHNHTRQKTGQDDAFIKEYYAERKKHPLWYELYQAAKDVKSKTYHISIEKALQLIDDQTTGSFKKLLTTVRQEYQIHKDFYFSDEQPLSSWRNEQVADFLTESEFLHFVAKVFGFDVVQLEQDEIMINSNLKKGVKPIEKEIKKCINANAGSNTLILIDELLPIDMEPEQEDGFKSFAAAWLKRHYDIAVSGDSFWI